MNFKTITRHTPVMLNEVIQSLQLKPGMNVVDCTLGDGGHAEAILEKIGPKGKLLGIDADVEALLQAKRFLYKFDKQLVVERDNFVNLKQILEKNNFGPVGAILMDLGWSSQQFMERGRGFSFLKDELLDMRYDIKSEILNPKSENKTATWILNNESEEELEKIFHLYGEERLSREISKAIVEARKKKIIEKTDELVEIIMGVYGGKRGAIHPATKVFQALRIAVNNELEVLKQALPQAVEALAPGGRLLVISFHSLEDRIVKQYFRSIDNKLVKIITKKPLAPSRVEVKNNPRARSAKMRVVEKLS